MNRSKKKTKPALQTALQIRRMKEDKFVHFLNPGAIRYTRSLGDAAGLRLSGRSEAPHHGAARPRSARQRRRPLKSYAALQTPRDDREWLALLLDATAFDEAAADRVATKADRGGRACRV